MAKPVTAAEEAKTDYASMSFDELQAIHSEVTAALEAKKDVKRQELLAQLEALGGIPKRQRKESSNRASPKVTHKGPNGETWTSRGTKPRWLAALIAEGHNPEEYRIKD